MTSSFKQPPSMAMAIKHLALKPPPATKSTKLGLLKLFAPQVPNLLVKSAGHFLSLTPQSGYWDLRTTLTVEFLRLWLGQPKQNTTVEDAQGITTKQAKVQANTWKVDVDVEVSPEDEKMLEELARRAIVVMGSANIEKHIPRVGVPSATGEWIGCRAKVMGEKEEHEEREGWSEGKKYQAMMEEMEGGEDGSVVLLLHGGAYWLCDPSSHRLLGRKIAKHTKGRVFMPRYRLAPQNPFPAALLDTFTAYLYLLYPPVGALHAPIPASKICIAGDSAGGGLAFAFLQLLLHLHRYREDEGEDGYENMPSSTPLHSPKLHWQGESRRVPLPAAIAGLSPWIEISRCLGEDLSFANGTKGSEDQCKTWDYLPTAREDRETSYKPSAAWPTEDGRSHMYTADPLITHPLVSPITAESWKGSPPVWISVGDECLRDGILYFSSRLLVSDVKLQLGRYTAMPHVFQGTVPHLPVSRKSFDLLTEFMSTAFGLSNKRLKLGEFIIHPVSLEEQIHDRNELSLWGLTPEELLEKMKKEVYDWAHHGSKSGIGSGTKDVEVAKL